jgi:hypothetical protein
VRSKPLSIGAARRVGPSARWTPLQGLNASRARRPARTARVASRRSRPCGVGQDAKRTLHQSALDASNRTLASCRQFREADGGLEPPTPSLRAFPATLQARRAQCHRRVWRLRATLRAWRDTPKDATIRPLRRAPGTTPKGSARDHARARTPKDGLALLLTRSSERRHHVEPLQARLPTLARGPSRLTGERSQVRNRPRPLERPIYGQHERRTLGAQLPQPPSPRARSAHAARRQARIGNHTAAR